MQMCGSKTRWLLILAVFALMAQTALGRIIYVDDDAPLTGDGSSWENAWPCLQNALETAQSGDEIRVAQGTYKPDRKAVGQRLNMIIEVSGDNSATFALKSDVELKGGYGGIGTTDPNACHIELYETILSGDLAGDDWHEVEGFEFVFDSYRQDNSWHVVTVPAGISDALLEGFTIANGSTEFSGFYGGAGAGLLKLARIPVRRCTFTRNGASRGGGAYVQGAGSDFAECTFFENFGQMKGSAVNIDYASENSFTKCYFAGKGNTKTNTGACVDVYFANVQFDNCVFTGCTVQDVQKGVVHARESNVALAGCTFSGNYPYSISCPEDYVHPSHIQLTNCILYDQTAAGSFLPTANSTFFTVNHCNVKGGFAGPGNIDADPLFADANGPDGIFGTLDDDLRLLPDSPCINAGDNSAVQLATDIGGSPRIAEGTVDMGAYEQWIIVEPGQLQIDEGQTAQFTVRLARDPGAAFEINLSLEPTNSNLPLDGDIAITSDVALTFDSSNYDQPQTVVIAAAEDSDVFDDSATMCFSTASSVSRLGNVAVNVYDNDIDPSAWVLHVDAAALTSGNGSSWSNPIKYLQDALAVARLSRSVSLIKVAQGTYKPDQGYYAVPGDRSAAFELVSETTLKGGYAGIAGANPDDRNVGAYRTILSGDLKGNDNSEIPYWSHYARWSYYDAEPSIHDNSFHVVVARGRDTLEDGIRLDGVTITAAVPGRSRNRYFEFVAGGMLIDDADPTIIQCTFTRNILSSGVYVLTGDPTFIDCLFNENYAWSYGAGLRVFDSYGTKESNTMLIGCRFENNYAGDDGGGMAQLRGSATLIDCEFNFNEVNSENDEGGGAVFEGVDVMLVDCTFLGNLADDGPSGGIVFKMDCIATLRGCLFAMNETSEDGGGILLDESSATLNDCTFIANNALDGPGGAICQYDSLLILESCFFGENESPSYSWQWDPNTNEYEKVPVKFTGGIYCNSSYKPLAHLVLDDCTFADNIGYDLSAHNTTVQLRSDHYCNGDSWALRPGSDLVGDGVLYLDENSEITTRETHWHLPLWEDGAAASIRCDVSGPGTIIVQADHELVVEGGSVIDLEDPILGPGDANGRILCEGLLRLRDTATIRNAEMEVVRASFEGDIGIYNSVITAEAGAPYGQFFVEDTASIIGNDIHADGDRFMDLDPAVFDGLIALNRIFVTITEGIGHTRGGLLELRGAPDLAGAGTQDPNNPFFCQVPAVPGFDPTTWTIEELRLIDNAKVNLTNRFDFQPPYDEGGEDEVLYVRNLYLGAGAVLNTSFNKIYYQNIYADPCSTAENVPLLGFSLNNIAFDDEVEFTTRVKYQNFYHPTDSEYDRIHVKRVEDLVPDPNGMMRMTNFIDRDPCSPTSGVLFNARVKGLFARANEDLLLITFEYLFETSDPDVELLVYLTDVPELMSHYDPNRPDHYIEVARIAPPPLTRPGSLGSGRFGVFYAYAQREHLNFLRGTRIEFELTGPAGSSVLINNWDPQVHCNPLYCGDITGDWGATQLDYLTVLAHVGCRSALPHDSGPSLTCMDAGFGSDGYIDALDAEGWDWRLNLPNPHFCDMPLVPTKDAKSAGALKTGAKMFSEADVYPSEGLLISGKRSVDKLADRHYILDDEGQYIASVDPGFIRANGRLIKDIFGELYQINLGEGLVRLSDGISIVPAAAVIIDFNEPRYEAGGEVRIGMHYEDYEWSGCPIFDAAFDPDGEHVYVAPVVIAPDGEEPYQAVAKLRLLDMGIPPYEVVQIYDDAPLPGDNQYLDNLREIEIDDSGNLYVTNTDSLNESDKLWVYDTLTGEVKKRLCLGREGSSTYIPAPIAMLLSSWGSLYLGSAVQESDADSVSVNVLSASSLSFVRKIAINNMGHVTAITEDASTGTIWVAGFTMSNIPEYIDPLGEPFYEPYIAKISLGATGPIEAEPLSDPASYPDNDLALPLSIISIKRTGVDCSTANIDGIGRVDFFDFVLFAAHWLETACSECEGADITGEGDVNTKDLQLLSHCWLNDHS